MTTIVKTYRFPEALYLLILNESEKLSISEADFIRFALRKYFEHQQEMNELRELENRLNELLKIHNSRIESLLRQVLALAQP